MTASIMESDKKKYLKRARSLRTKRTRHSVTLPLVSPLCSTATTPTTSRRPLRRHSHFPPSGATPAPDPTETGDAPTEDRLALYVDVNRELKRLLVASVGHDMEQLIGQLVIDKAQLQLKFDRSLEQLTAYREEVDQSIVEGDIWRSKFLASRVMIEELTGWKATIFGQYHACRRALEVFLSERGQLHRNLSSCHGILSGVDRSLKMEGSIKNDSKSLTHTDTTETQKADDKGNILDLSADTVTMATSILNQVGHSDNGIISAHNHEATPTTLTRGETLARQALKQPVPLSRPHPPRHSLPHLSFSEKHLLKTRQERLKTLVPLEELWSDSNETISCHWCSYCRGDVMTV